MPKLSDITPEQRFVAMFVGESGTGKTCAACSFPKPLEDLDFDGRIRGAWNKPWIPMEGISYEFFPPRQNGMIEGLNKKLEAMQLVADMGSAAAMPLPKTEVLDSLTSECFAMVMQAMPLTHSPGGKGEQKKGKYLGITPMAGPEDYGFEAQVTYSLLSWFRSMPIPNIIVTAHVVPIYGKEDPGNPFSNNIVVGEKLSVRDKIGANVGIYFDHVFRFKKGEGAFQKEKYTVQFRGGLCRTAWDFLPDGEVDITGINFYEKLMSYFSKEK